MPAAGPLERFHRTAGPPPPLDDEQHEQRSQCRDCNEEFRHVPVPRDLLAASCHGIKRGTPAVRSDSRESTWNAKNQRRDLLCAAIQAASAGGVGVIACD